MLDNISNELPTGFSIDERLRELHLQNAQAEIEGPDVAGAFPGSDFLSAFGGAIPIVVDANVLRRDIAHTFAKGHHSTLVSIANSGAARMYCAQHVVEEVLEHSAEWAQGSNIGHEAFLECFATKYVPLIRMIPADTLNLDLLSPQERQRIDVLMSIDPDDVPSVILSLVLGALFVTQDTDARRAVYGSDIDWRELTDWIVPLKVGGDAGELGRLCGASFAASFATLAGLTALVRYVYVRAPWLLGIVAGTGAVAAILTPPETYKTIGSKAKTGASLWVNSVFVPYFEARAKFLAAAPAIPKWKDLAPVNNPRAVRTRACAYTLARSAEGNQTARQVSEGLPDLRSVGTSENPVRATLRSSGCFTKVYGHNWQLGQPIELNSTRQHLAAPYDARIVSPQDDRALGS